MSLNGYQFFIINQMPDCRRHILATLLWATRGPSLGHLSDLCQICVRSEQPTSVYKIWVAAHAPGACIIGVHVVLTPPLPPPPLLGTHDKHVEA